jgi:hypothetical protein
MLKFREVGTYKDAVNIGYLTADVVLKNGNVVTYDLAKKKAALPKTGKESGLAIVINTIDKPEISEPNAFTIEIGENPRIFTLESLKDRVIDMDMDQVTGTYTDIKEGDFLVADTTGKLKVVKAASGVTDYKEYLKVIEKTTYNAEGLAAVVVIA